MADWVGDRTKELPVATEVVAIGAEETLLLLATVTVG